MKIILFLSVIFLSSCQDLKKPEFFNYESSFKIVSKEVKDKKTYTQHLYKLNNGFLYINRYKENKIDKINEVINNKKLVLNSLYAEQKSPYPGSVSNVIACPTNYSPQEQTVDDEYHSKIQMTLFANQFKLYGACVKDNIKYSSGYVLLTCKKDNTFYEIKLFIEGKTLDDSIQYFITSVHCKN